MEPLDWTYKTSKFEMIGGTSLMPLKDWALATNEAGPTAEPGVPPLMSQELRSVNTSRPVV